MIFRVTSSRRVIRTSLRHRIYFKTNLSLLRHECKYNSTPFFLRSHIFFFLSLLQSSYNPSMRSIISSSSVWPRSNCHWATCKSNTIQTSCWVSSMSDCFLSFHVLRKFCSRHETFFQSLLLYVRGTDPPNMSESTVYLRFSTSILWNFVLLWNCL